METTLTFSMEEFQRRHNKIRESMELRGLDCLIIYGHTGIFGSSAADLRYVCGDIDILDQCYAVFPHNGDPTLYGVARRLSTVDPASVLFPVPLEPWVDEAIFRPGWNYEETIAERIRELGLEKGMIGIVTMRDFPSYLYLNLRKELPYVEFVSAGDLTLEIRRVKSQEEIAYIRKAGECADAGVKAMAAAAVPGASQRDLIQACDFGMIEAGAERGNFISCSFAPWDAYKMGTQAPWEAKPDPDSTSAFEQKPGEAGLKRGDIILSEITANYGGYYVQICPPIIVGDDIPRGFKEHFDLHRDIYHLALQELRPGIRVQDIEMKVAALARERLGFIQAWAIQSMEIAEAFHTVYHTELRPGMSYMIHACTWPPGHIVGNTCIITEGEPEVVSNLPLEIIVV